MKTVFLRAASVILLPLGVAACVAPAPHTEAHIGESTVDMRNAQVMNPAASQNATAPTGIDSSTAKASYEQYQKSYKVQERSNNTFVIGIGR